MQQNLQQNITYNDSVIKNYLTTVAISTSDVIFNFININDFKTLGNKILAKITIVLFDTPQQITDVNQIQQILHENHNTPIGGHVGISRLYKKLKNMYTWPNMKYTVAKFVKNCEQCKRNKHFPGIQRKLVVTSTPTKVFDVVSIDTVGPFSISEKGNRYAVTIQCDLSKYIIIVPIPDKSSITIARAIVENCILIYGPMKAIRTDQGTEYKGVFDSVCSLLQINHNLATAYHLQTIDALERNHRCLNEYLRTFINEAKNNWLPYYCFCYNTTPNTDNHFSPFEIVFGNSITAFQNYNQTTIDPIYNYDSYTKELKYRLQTIHKYIFDKMIQVKSERTEQANKLIDQTEIYIGDDVYLKAEKRKKFDRVQEDPYTIINLTDSKATIKHTTTNDEITVHKSRLVKFK